MIPVLDVVSPLGSITSEDQSWIDCQLDLTCADTTVS